MMDEEVKSVAVIGAGMSGLLALHHLSESKKKFNLTAFERNYDIGGLWLYTDQTTLDEFGLPVHSAMYHDLRTNLPKQLMTIPGFEFDDHVPNFPDRHDMLKYLQNFCDKKELRKYIKFNTLVKKVIQKDPVNRETKWRVSYSDIRKQNCATTEEYDFVVVCNGNCFSPRIPKIEGSETFSGLIKHSINYRRPNIYSSQTVAILGGSFSAQDISLQLKNYAHKVFICHNGPPLSTPLPSNIIEKISSFDRITNNSVILHSGDELIVDSIIYCTGYMYHYPFLPDGIVKIEKENLRNLYLGIIPDMYTSIMFMSTARSGAFFPMADIEARFIKTVLEGTTKLPEPDVMRQIIDDGFDNKEEMADKSFEAIEKRLTQIWNRSNHLAKFGSFDPLPDVLRYIYFKIFKYSSTDFTTFRNYVFRITSHDTFDVTYNKPRTRTDDA